MRNSKRSVGPSLIHQSRNALSHEGRNESTALTLLVGGYLNLGKSLSVNFIYDGRRLGGWKRFGNRFRLEVGLWLNDYINFPINYLRGWIADDWRE